jgi:hypothetical protein
VPRTVQRHASYATLTRDRRAVVVLGLLRGSLNVRSVLVEPVSCIPYRRNLSLPVERSSER